MESTKRAPAVSFQGVAYKIFKFFASLKLAVIVIVSLMVILAAGTIIESRHGADAAKLVVYESPWFSLVLFFLGINVTAAALDRLPWKRNHIGFVTTHTGIILILIGSFISQQTMIDAQMILEEGETDYRITLAHPILYVLSDDQKNDWILPVKKEPFAWTGERSVSKGEIEALEIDATAYYPRGYMEEKIVPAASGSPALKVKIQNSFVDQTFWLMKDDAERGSIQMGPATFSFSDTYLEETKEVSDDTEYLEFIFGNESVRVPLTADVLKGEVTPLGSLPYQVKIDKMYDKAYVIGKELIESDDAATAKNPAIVLTLTGEGLIEKHTAFMNFPDFPTMHGMQESATGARLFYRRPNAGSKGERHELRFIRTETGFDYQVQNGLKVITQKGKVNEEVVLGWMDLTMKVEEFFQSAEVRREFREAPNVTQAKNAFTAIQLRIRSGEEEVTRWVGQGFRETVTINGQTYHLFFGQRRVPVGFRLTLKDFKIEEYPGTNQPASFESDVILRDSSKGVMKETTISMNEPLEHEGFKIYQSGYQQEPGQPEVSIFSVGRDPGIPFKYGGTIVMVIGIVTMFFTRKYSTRAGKIHSA